MVFKAEIAFEQLGASVESCKGSPTNQTSYNIAFGRSCSSSSGGREEAGTLHITDEEELNPGVYLFVSNRPTCYLLGDVRAHAAVKSWLSQGDGI